MNEHDGKMLDSYRSFLLISEIAKEESLSQRELAQRLGIALGLVNSYLKNLVAKGYVRVRNFPRNRYAYLLTPQGVAEKTRLAYRHLQYFTDLYTITRQDYMELLHRLNMAGVRDVVFCGLDEVTEIAYLSLLETEIRLVAVMDDEAAGKNFFGFPVVSIADGLRNECQRIVLTSLKKGDLLRTRLEELSVDGATICAVAKAFPPGPEGTDVRTK